MAEEIRKGLLVVVIRYPGSDIHPHLVGQIFTIKAGPIRWRPWSARIVWIMEETWPDTEDYYCFARHEFRPLPPPDDLLKKFQQRETSS